MHTSVRQLGDAGEDYGDLRRPASDTYSTSSRSISQWKGRARAAANDNRALETLGTVYESATLASTV